MSAAVAPEPSAPFGQWTGGQASDRAFCLLQGNPGPMTLDGTNTWVLMDPGGTEAIVIDPGEDEAAHQQRVVDHVTALGARVTRIVLTHGHFDHSEGAPRLAQLTGAPVQAVGRGHDDLGDGDVLTAGGLEVRVVATPGHTSDSISFALAADHALLTGDTVLGRGTTMVAHPDGELAAYLDSLERIKALTGDGEVAAILPGHGPTVPDAAAMVDFYRVHRRERLEQVRAAMADGAADADAVVASVYADVDRSVWPAAKLSVLAQMRYLGD
ncbi:MBL fold metallo-hydrolase [Janibacter sp. Soil728]|nr:MBL fold metallo-hydrolase [Janibacter sp. Soil728]